MDDLPRQILRQRVGAPWVKVGEYLEAARADRVGEADDEVGAVDHYALTNSPCVLIATAILAAYASSAVSNVPR